MDFQERIASLKDTEIVKIIRSKDEYQDEFWKLCVFEAKNRSIEGIQQIIDDIQRSKLEHENLKIEQAHKEANLPVLYSEKTIIIFSFLFTPLAGSVLFAINLKKMGRKDFESVLGIGLFYTILTFALAFLLPLGNMKPLSYIVNLIAGFIMIFQFSNKYYPEKFEYKKKNALPAYIIGFAVLFLVAFIIYFNSIL